jgi:hypothetical protein
LEAKVIRLTIPNSVLSNNEVIKMHWAVKRATRRAYGWALQAAILESREIEPEFLYRKTRRRVKIVSYRGRTLDPDNLSGGAKILIDAMRDLGLIFRDSKKWIILEIDDRLDRLNPRTEIEIEEEISVAGK